MRTTYMCFLVAVLLIPSFVARAAINSMNGLTVNNQFLVATTSDQNLSIHISSSSPSTHFFAPIWSGTLQPSRGGTGSGTFASGSIPFFQNNKFTEDNTNLFWDFAHSLLNVTNLVFSSSTGDHLTLNSLAVSGTTTMSTTTATSLTLGNPLGINSGGTGLSGFSTGDILIATGPSTLTKLPIGADGQVLMVSSTAPHGIAWVTLPKPKHFQVDTAGTLLTSLQGYYKLEDATDYSGISNLTLTNNNLVAFNGGKISNAADGGSSNSNKYLSAMSSFGYTGGAYSFDSWAKVSTLPANNSIGVFVSVGDSSSNTSLSVWYFNDAGTPKVEWVRTKYGVADQKVTEIVTLTAGTWYHFALRYDGTTLEGFRDGVSKGTISASGSGIAGQSNVSTVLAWANGSGGTYTFSGLVDELGLWTKSLSNTEISDLYNSGSGQTMTQ